MYFQSNDSQVSDVDHQFAAYGTSQEMCIFMTLFVDTRHCQNTIAA